MRTVLVFGTFDLMHPGHLSFLRQARAKGDRLVVSVAKDGFVERMKGRRPVHSEEERRRQVLATGIAEDVRLSDKVMGTYSVVSAVSPDVICFGHDQHELREHLSGWMREHGMGASLFTLKPYKPERFKTSRIHSGRGRSSPP